MPHPRRLFYVYLGLVLIPLGLAGVVLPGVPGIPLLIAAAASLAVAHRPAAGTRTRDPFDGIEPGYTTGVHGLFRKPRACL